MLAVVTGIVADIVLEHTCRNSFCYRFLGVSDEEALDFLDHTTSAWTGTVRFCRNRFDCCRVAAYREIDHTTHLCAHHSVEVPSANGPLVLSSTASCLLCP